MMIFFSFKGQLGNTILGKSFSIKCDHDKKTFKKGYHFQMNPPPPPLSSFGEFLNQSCLHGLVIFIR